MKKKTPPLKKQQQKQNTHLQDRIFLIQSQLQLRLTVQILVTDRLDTAVEYPVVRSECQGGSRQIFWNCSDEIKWTLLIRVFHHPSVVWIPCWWQLFTNINIYILCHAIKIFQVLLQYGAKMPKLSEVIPRCPDSFSTSLAQVSWYKAITSDAYMVLACDDPLKEAFDVCQQIDEAARYRINNALCA